MERGLEWVFRVTGLQAYAHMLHDSEEASKAIVVLIAVATLAHFAAGE